MPLVSALSEETQDALVREFAFMPGRLTLSIWPERLGEQLARVNTDPYALEQAETFATIASSKGARRSGPC